MRGKASAETTKTESLHVFTDKPANCTRLPDGHIDFDGPCNVVVRRVTRKLDMPAAECRLAVRSAFGGARRFRTGDGCHMVDDSGYLLLNLGQTVSSELVDNRLVECLNVTFQPEFAERVLSGLAESHDRLLDDPARVSGQPVRFFEKRYAHDDLVSPVLFRLRRGAANGNVTSGWMEENMHDLLRNMLQAHRQVTREIQTLSSIRKSTRVEIYRRLSVARDFIESNYAEAITLDDMAASAYLSPHHFLRLFKDAFGSTPHRYLTGKRLERAKSLLAGTNMLVTDVCLEVGFESLGSFSWLFKQKFNVTPSEYRRDKSISDSPQCSMASH